MANPDYLELFNQITAEEDPDTRAALVAQLYAFDAVLTAEEKKIFGYVFPGYIENDPGYDADGNFISYIGTYFDDDGNIAGELPE